MNPTVQPEPIQPNQNKLFTGYFQQWLSTPDSQKFILNQIEQIDHDLGKEYQDKVVDGVKYLVQNISDLVIDKEEAKPTSKPEDIVPPKSPNRRKVPMEDKCLSITGLCVEIEKKKHHTSEVLKTDSGIHLDDEVLPAPAIPRFYFPYGKASNTVDISELKQKIKPLFDLNASGLSERDFVKVTEAVGVCKYLNAALFRKVSVGADVAKFNTFLDYWKTIVPKCHTPEAVAFNIMKQENANHLVASDVSNVVLHHPGLEFLNTLPLFQNRYSTFSFTLVETVITRLFYEKMNNTNTKMSFLEFKKGGFLKSLTKLECTTDINTTKDLFSYQHFYVIYCKFWELDRDHDMIINFPSLLRYDGGAMTSAILTRVIQGCGKPLVKGPNSCLMTYEDFIWFIFAVEDKRTPQAIEYWFRCLDLDGDGVISLYELTHFYTEQFERMKCSRISDEWKMNDFICSLIDLVKPKNPNYFTLSDLKRSGSAPLFFDMIFDLRKYDSHIRRIDPVFRDMDDMICEENGTPVKLEGFQKFAFRAYQILAEEESQSGNTQDVMDDFEYNGVADADMDIEWDENIDGTWDNADDDDEPESHTITL
ncbi:Serine/threonine-protein phosphatase 2A regulatory subunit B'' subunit alpha [Terramyces sp. JEL0728]|nr:Serine/threonine-protein phosphatase 2A regulatory subunit B'' subunit alpha [Terramyces sp. JEL0728]